MYARRASTWTRHPKRETIDRFDLNPDYHIFTDIGQHDTDDILKKNYVGWGSSGLTSLTMMHEGIFNIHQCRKYE